MFVTLKINEGNAIQAKSTHLLPLTFNVTCAEKSLAPRSDCSPIDELIRDQRSVVSTAQSIHTLCNFEAGKTRYGISNFVCRLTTSPRQLLLKGAWLGSCDHHLYFGTRSLNLEWVKLSTSNFVQRLNKRLTPKKEAFSEF